MLTLQVHEKKIDITNEAELVRGTVGAACKIEFDEFWSYYENTIVFKRDGYEPINIITNKLINTIEIPFEILEESGSFKIGAFGIKPNEVLPTLWSNDIKIRYGTDTKGVPPQSYTPSEIEQLRLSKQDALVSGENIKTINGQSILGEGNINIQGGGGSIIIDQTYNPKSENAQSGKAVAEAVSAKMDKFGEISELESRYVITPNKTIVELNGRFDIAGDNPNDIDSTYQIVNYGIVNKLINNSVGDIETALDNIIAIQNSLIGGGNV